MSGGGPSGGGGTTTTTSGPSPEVLQQYRNVTGIANNVAQTPLRQYAGPLVQGFTPMQQQAFQGVEDAQGIANPYINAAAQYAGSSATPIGVPGGMSSDSLGSLAGTGLGNLSASTALTDPSNYAANIGSYMSPYTQQVVDATQAQFNNQNAQQNQNIIGNAISKGAWGGDRAGVAQGIAAGQEALAQAPVIAGLYNTGFSNAQGEINQAAAQRQQAAAQQLGLYTNQQQQGIGAQEATGWLGSNAGNTLGALGQQAQSSALTGASALYSLGNNQQALGQEQLNIPYEQFQAQQAYPFQTTNWLSNLSQGIGGASGGTSSSTAPGASTGSQILGGLAGTAGLLGATDAFGNSTSGPNSGYLTGFDGLFGGATSSAATYDPSVLSDAYSSLLSARGGRIPHRAFGGAVGTPDAFSSDGFALPGVPDASVPFIPLGRASSGSGGGGGLPPVVTKTSGASGGDSTGSDVMNGIKTAATIASFFVNRGGRIPRRLADGGVPSSVDPNMAALLNQQMQPGMSAPAPQSGGGWLGGVGGLSGGNMGNKQGGTSGGPLPQSVQQGYSGAISPSQAGGGASGAGNMADNQQSSGKGPTPQPIGAPGSGTPGDLVNDTFGHPSTDPGPSGAVGFTPRGNGAAPPPYVMAPQLSGMGGGAPSMANLLNQQLQQNAGPGAPPAPPQPTYGPQGFAPTAPSVWGNSRSTIPAAGRPGISIPQLSTPNATPTPADVPANLLTNYSPPPVSSSPYTETTFPILTPGGTGAPTTTSVRPVQDANGNWAAPPPPPPPPGQSATGPANWGLYLTQNPDVAKEAQRVVADGEFPNANAYAQWHYQKYGSAEGRAYPGTPPSASSAAAPGGMGQASSGIGVDLSQLGGNLNFARGGSARGPAGFRAHYDGGGIVGQAGAASAGMPVGMGNPLAQGSYQNFAQLPPEKLQELAVRLPPNSPQGAMVRRALQMAHSSPAMARQPMAPSNDMGQAQQQPMMARGGRMPMGFASGGDTPVPNRRERLETAIGVINMASDPGGHDMNDPRNVAAGIMRGNIAANDMQGAYVMPDAWHVTMSDLQRKRAYFDAADASRSQLDKFESENPGYANGGRAHFDQGGASDGFQWSPLARDIGELIPGSPSVPSDTEQWGTIAPEPGPRIGLRDIWAAVPDSLATRAVKAARNPQAAPSISPQNNPGLGGASGSWDDDHDYANIFPPSQGPAGFSGFPQGGFSASPLVAQPDRQSLFDMAGGSANASARGEGATPSAQRPAGFTPKPGSASNTIPAPPSAVAAPSASAKPSTTEADATTSAADDSLYGGMLKSPWMALAATGAGIMAGHSPQAGVNIGEGLLTGLKFAGAQQTEAQKEKAQQAETQWRNKDVDLRAQELSQKIQSTKDQLALDSKKESDLEQWRAGDLSLRKLTENRPELQLMGAGKDPQGNPATLLFDVHSGQTIYGPPSTPKNAEVPTQAEKTVNWYASPDGPFKDQPGGPPSKGDALKLFLSGHTSPKDFNNAVQAEVRGYNQNIMANPSSEYAHKSMAELNQIAEQAVIHRGVSQQGGMAVLNGMVTPTAGAVPQQAETGTPAGMTLVGKTPTGQLVYQDANGQNHVQQ